VIDTGNYWAPRDGANAELEAKELADSEPWPTVWNTASTCGADH
jgi:hypothetical protein